MRGFVTLDGFYKIRIYTIKRDLYYLNDRFKYSLLSKD